MSEVRKRMHVPTHAVGTSKRPRGGGARSLPPGVQSTLQRLQAQQGQGLPQPGTHHHSFFTVSELRALCRPQRPAHTPPDEVPPDWRPASRVSQGRDASKVCEARLMLVQQRRDHMPKENVRSAALQRALAQYETKHAILDENLQFWMEQKQNRMAMGRSAPRPRPANV